ncbi:thioredoxin-like protein [Dactylonectria estremocensis]|uniref:Thioredoxin-like protein n=1 Tax=Dactylonectria estremocensis TaxID=1079267 RepID=A0A9P9FBS5_9HYPO|nr:thioredoxin-like protein [Dactylonectria estremocensis]
MRIEIVVHADLLCPWSFVEKRSLETAMYRYKTRHPDVEFEVVWKPFLLYPRLQYMIETTAVDKRDLYMRIMDTEELRTFIDGVQAAGTRHGVDFAARGATGPSQRGHRLVALALRTLGPVAQAAVVESIFRGHFEHGMDVADAKWLLSVGSSVGLEPKAVLSALDCPAMGRMLDDEMAAAKAAGVIAVPSVLIGARFRVAGYQDPDLFEGAFDRLRKEREQGLVMMNQAVRCARLGQAGLRMSREVMEPDEGDQAPNRQGPVPNEGGQGRFGQGLGPNTLAGPAPELARQKPALLEPDKSPVLIHPAGQDQDQYLPDKGLLHMEHTHSRFDDAAI